MLLFIALFALLVAYCFQLYFFSPKSQSQKELLLQSIFLKNTKTMNYLAGTPLFDSEHPIVANMERVSEVTSTQIDFKLCNGLWAVRCENVFSGKECQQIIDAAEARGFEQALLNVGGGNQVLATGYRKSLRVMTDDPKLADSIFNRIKHVLPQTFKGRKLVGLNERLRILKYQPGDFFRYHMDGTFLRQNDCSDGRYRKGDQSFITMLFYLNEGYEGAETTFYCNPESVSLKVIPSTGMILLHDHRVLHGVPELKKGIKYVIRSDVMFSPN